MGAAPGGHDALSVCVRRGLAGCRRSPGVAGLYDPATEFCAIGLLCLLVGYGLWRGSRLSYDEVLAWTFPLFATGCLLLPVLWPVDAVAAGLLVKCGYTLYQVMFWMLLVRKAYEDPRHTYL